MKNKIKINIDEGCGEGREHTPAEKKFLNKLTVGVCAIAVLIMFAAHHLFPIIN